MRRRSGLVLAWVVAAVLAVTVGLLAVSTVGASIRGRGPLGTAVVPEGREPTVPPSSLPAAGPAQDFPGEWGTFSVSCRGAYAVGVSQEAAPGWRIVSFETGPDDDVDVVFSSGARSVEVEVYCNAGRPTIADVEPDTLPQDD